MGKSNVSVDKVLLFLKLNIYIMFLLKVKTHLKFNGRHTTSFL